MRRSRALFQIDAGWLFLAAGLVMLAAIVLVPEQEELRLQSSRLQRLQWENRVLNQTMGQFALTLQLLESDDPELKQRLIEARLHQVRSGRNVHLVADSINQPIGAWVDELGHAPPPRSIASQPTLLSSMVGSGFRLWILGGATLSIFIGLVLGGAAEPLVMDMARRLMGRSSHPELSEPQPHIFASEEDAPEEEPPVPSVSWQPSAETAVFLAAQVEGGSDPEAHEDVQDDEDEEFEDVEDQDEGEEFEDELAEEGVEDEEEEEFEDDEEDDEEEEDIEDEEEEEEEFEDDEEEEDIEDEEDDVEEEDEEEEEFEDDEEEDEEEEEDVEDEDEEEEDEEEEEFEDEEEDEEEEEDLEDEEDEEEDELEEEEEEDVDEDVEEEELQGDAEEAEADSVPASDAQEDADDEQAQDVEYEYVYEYVDVDPDADPEEGEEYVYEEVEVDEDEPDTHTKE